MQQPKKAADCEGDGINEVTIVPLLDHSLHALDLGASSQSFDWNFT